MGDQPSGFRPAMINLINNFGLWKNKDQVMSVNTSNLSGYITGRDDKCLMIAAKNPMRQGGGKKNKKNKTKKHRSSKSNKKKKHSRKRRNNH